jgi:membrane protein YqaA with SNARE-associated domain
MKITYNRSIFPFLQHVLLKWGSCILFISAFIDSSFLLFPVAALFILVLIIAKMRSTEYIISVTLGTITGAMAGFAMGHFILINGDDRFTAFVQNIMDHNMGFSDLLHYKLRILLNKRGFLGLASAFITQIPYGMFSISSGLCNLNFIGFTIITALFTFLKFSVLGILTLKAVRKIKSVIDYRREASNDVSVEIRYPEIGW